MRFRLASSAGRVLRESPIRVKEAGIGPCRPIVQIHDFHAHVLLLRVQGECRLGERVAIPGMGGSRTMVIITNHEDGASGGAGHDQLPAFDFTVNDMPRLKEMYEQCMPYYDKLFAARIKPPLAPE